MRHTLVDDIWALEMAGADEQEVRPLLRDATVDEGRELAERWWRALRDEDERVDEALGRDRR